ncbi:helix-turn-helix domain-containing protein [Bacillus sp. 165]|uniref:response regulator transcription factor n=1 Tax=Bacillus sp. 165 TaxID=1529117 RepID=UPI001ADD56C7|nr:helix-turn-helix domain-containing protein [Bacillus sp. 165]MBO9131054.1 response regulator [Bacillus sp. 165]
MYRLLIVDDEPLEREGLELMIKRSMPNQFQIEQAENGRIAIEKSIEYQPHIIFMDIKMPGIQGLEAVSVIKQKLPDTKTIIVTAYDYFTYAQEAISLGVKEYILKPAKKDQIISLLQKMISEIEDDHKKRLQELKSIENLSLIRPLTENECTLMLMFNTVQELNVSQLSEILGFEINLGYASVIKLPKEIVQNEKEQRRIYECVKHFMKSSRVCLVSPIVDGQLATFIPVQLKQEDLQKPVLYQDALKTIEYIENQTGYKTMIGIGSLKLGVEGLRQSYKEALYASLECEELTRVCLFSEKFTLSISDEEKQILIDSFRKADLEDVLNQFNNLFERFMKYDVKQVRTELHSLLNQSVQFLRNSSIEVEKFHIPDLDDISQLKKAVEQQIVNLITKIDREKEIKMNHMMILAREYIAHHFIEDISLEQVANYLKLNPFYFSKLFKKQTGETFSDYLTNMRINKAKQLMEKSELSLKEICYQVGYNDPNYFSRVFKKCTNESPKEYRKTLLRNL